MNWLILEHFFSWFAMVCIRVNEIETEVGTEFFLKASNSSHVFDNHLLADLNATVTNSSTLFTQKGSDPFLL